MSEEPIETTEDGRPLICDRCGKPLRRFQPHCSVAYDEEKALGRHWDCHSKMQEDFTASLKHVKEAEGKFKSLLNELRRKL